MGTTSRERIRVLGVDDEEVILELYREILRFDSHSNAYQSIPYYFETSICQQGDEAVEHVRASLLEHDPYALILLDINMPPGPDGISTAQIIRGMDPDVNIVLATGYSGCDLRDISRKIMPPDKLLYIQKPFHPQEILQLAAALGGKWLAELQYRRIQENLEVQVKQRTSALTQSNLQLKKEVEHRTRTEAALRASEANFRNIISSNADAIVILSSAGEALYVNPAGRSFFGGREADFKTPFEIPLKTGGEPVEMEIADRGTLRVAEVRFVETKWEGKTAFLASLRDVTQRKQMERELEKNLQQLQTTIRGTIQAMASAVEKRDPYTAGHQQRVADLSKAIAEALDLPDEKIQGLYLAALIHDVGKISVPAEILSKPGNLTEIELMFIQTHARSGYEILREIPFPWPIAEIVLQHHEKIDGSGYPNGLSGNQILTEAKILSVADVVEAMASHRPYRPSLGITAALEEIEKKKGIHFDEKAVDACLLLFTRKDFAFQL